MGEAMTLFYRLISECECFSIVGIKSLCVLYLVFSYSFDNVNNITLRMVAIDKLTYHVNVRLSHLMKHVVYVFIFISLLH